MAKALSQSFQKFITKCRACLLLSGSNDDDIVLRGELCTLCETSVLLDGLFSQAWAGDASTLEILYALCLNR